MWLPTLTATVESRLLQILVLFNFQTSIHSLSPQVHLTDWGTLNFITPPPEKLSAIENNILPIRFNHQRCSSFSRLPDKGQRQDVVRVHSDEPITVLGVRVGVRVVGRQDESVGARQVSSARRCSGGREENGKLYDYSKKVLKCHKIQAFPQAFQDEEMSVK